jgi:glycosyltransferase involved in cell wall biosynthesis
MVSLRLTAPNAYDVWNGIGQADRVIASGTSIAKIRATLREDVVEIPNGVDLDLFRPAVTAPEGPPILLYVARFQAFKNHALLIRAFKQVAAVRSDVRLQLAGSGPLRGAVEDQVKAAGLAGRVDFLGEVPHHALAGVCQRATVAVIASEYESFCFAAIEAMAAGLPVVTTDCGWAPRLIGDPLPPIEKQWIYGGDQPGRFADERDGFRIRPVAGGLVVSRTEPDSMANALLRLVNDTTLCAQLGRWNREQAESEHGWPASAQRYLKECRQACAE